MTSRDLQGAVAIVGLAGRFSGELDRFDAGFFGINHREAEILDPQQRVFLEACWEALEDAGYESETVDLAGVFAGQPLSSYLLHNLLPALTDTMDPLQLLVGNAADSLATRVSYKLNLKGPSFTVQAGESTLGLAVHLARQSLLNGECDLALAGWVSIDARTLQGECVVLVLKRAEEAVRDRDNVQGLVVDSEANHPEIRLELEEAPEIPATRSVRDHYLLPVSARSEAALERACQRLADWLEAHPALELADIEYTLTAGRKRFEHQRLIECGTTQDAVHALRAGSAGILPAANQKEAGRMPALPAKRVSLPTYPFERRRYWIEPVPASSFHPRPALFTPYEPPRDEAEAKVSAIWQEVLGVSPVGAHDDFFQLGGHSLLAPQILGRVREVFGVEFPLQHVFSFPTPAELAEAIRFIQADQQAPSIPLSPRRETGGPYPVSFAQERLWFVDRLEPGNPIYNEPRAAHISGALDVARLEGSLRALVRRQEALRTKFQEIDGEPWQVVDPDVELRLPVVDLAALPEPQFEAERLTREEARRPFDLARGPVLRTTLLRMAAAEHVVLFTVHHIASDGWSLDLLVGEVAALYAGTPLPALPIQYADFAEWQRERLRGEALEPLLAHWRGELAGAPTVLDLPADRPRPSVPTWRGGWERLPLPGVVGPLDDLGRHEGASRFMTLLAGFQALLHRVTGQDDLLVGSPVANRTRPEIEGLVGFFVNLLVLRSRFPEALTFRGLLGQVRDTSLRAYEHQDAPFERLVETMEVARDLSRPPLVQALFVLQNPPLDSVHLPGLTLAAREVHAGVARYDLTLFASEAGGELAAGLEFSADLFEAATARRMLGWLAALVDGALAEPDRRVDELPLLAEGERRQLLVDWQPGDPVASAETVLDLFDGWVERTPEAPAVVFGDQQVTYRELADRAERLARHLRRLGVGPETIVGLQLERSPDLATGALGVLRAGGAYLPLDPAYPAERLDWMAEDSGAKLRLTSIPAPEAGGDEPLPRPEPGDLAYLIYTSGSTGRPKAVMVTHRGLPFMADGQERTLDVRPGDRVLQFSSPSFDASVWELWQALAHGAALVMAPREELLPGPGLADLMRRQGVTHATLPPSALAVLPAGAEEKLPRLRTLCVAGEACPPELARRWSRGRRFVNAYGPTEGTVCAAVGGLSEGGRLPIGRPFAGFRLHVLDARGVPVPVGVPGELCFGGPGLARGYLGRPDLTAQRFVPDPFGQEARLYRTGDLVRRLPDGQLEYLGRIDNQIKLRGVRIELGEIEAALAGHPGVVEARVVVREDEPGDRRLVAFVVPGGENPGEAILREALRRGLPEVMVPSRFVFLPALPMTPNGKVDTARLARMEIRPDSVTSTIANMPLGKLEAAIAAVWREILKVDRVERDDNFFDLGGHSLLLPKLHVRLREALKRDLTLVDLFRHPTVGSLARFLSPAPAAALQVSARPREIRADGRLAIVGLSCRFPGARDADELWRNLRDGVESIRRLSRENLAALGADPALLDDPAWVPAVAMPEDFDRFDARFFGLSAREAEVLDPQQRLFLEAAWTALEDAGCDPETTGERVGVFAGAGLSVYLVRHLVPQAEARSLDPLQAMIANMPDSLTARVSYKLGLRGPSFSVQSACSTSMVAVHQARLSLLAGECDVALAGGVSLPLSHLAGYRYQEGSIASPDGHCRAFDARARGTVFGGGAGVVVLKRLEDALADGDAIRAVLLGSAVNNDGSLKVGFTAPSVEGQEEVLREALAAAGVEPGSISYVEAHGTGTEVGDPIEVQALSRVLGGRDQACALGSVKTNFGHLDTAAGVAGLIKTVLALQNRRIPPSLHYETPNPAIDFERSPVRVNRHLADWRSEGPRRAGVSSFGIGGTNAHAVLEEAPPISPSSPARRGWHLLVLSARTPEALERATQNLADHFRRHPDLDPSGMEDVAWTLQAGRRAFRHRRAVVCRGPEDAAEALESLDPARVWTGDGDDGPRPVAFLLSGQGSQHPGMGRELYEAEPVFRREIDRCAEWLDFDLRGALWGEGASDERLRRTEIAQPALFAFEYALARLWQDWGIAPDALLGHSVGEYVAACLAGVMTLEDALALVAARGRLMADVAPGEMLAVPLPEREVAALLAGFPDLSLAAVNEPSRCVIAGPAASIKALEGRLGEAGVSGRRLHTSRAFHSAMMEPVLDRFEAEVRKVRLSPPSLPFLSNVTGAWITAAEATDPAYWRRHLRQAVRFADGVAELVRAPRRTLLEVGPGTALATMAKRQAAGAEVLASSPHPGDRDPSGTRSLLAALGRLWIGGQPVDWRRVRGDERRLRVPLPTYPFERQRFWIEPLAVAPKTERAREASVSRRLHGRRGAAGRGLKRSPAGSARTERRQPLRPVPMEAVGTETERRIIVIWRDLLGATSIGPRDDFFELGGDSLVGIQLTAALRRTFGVDLPLRDLFEVPRVADLAARVEALLGTVEEEEAPPILPVPRTGDLPLSFGQERLWFLDRLEPDSPLYNIPAALRLTGRLDPAALERSLSALVERHESLRTTFGESAGEPVQIVSSPVPQPLPRIDLSGLPEREKEAHRLVREEAGRPFDLRRGPLLRTRLIRLGDEEWVLTINVHHIVSDGWSVGVMVRETAALYQGVGDLSELPVQYPDYAVWQRRWLQGEVLRRQLDWWQRALDGAPTLLELPADRPRPAVQTWRGGAERVGLGPNLGRAVRGLAQRDGATPFLVLMAAFQELLRRHAHQDDLLVGTPVANRNRVEVKDLIGFFVNTLVLRRPAGAETFRELLAGVKAFSLEAFAHQDLPFERLVEELGVERSLAHSPLFQTLFVLQNNPVPSLSLGGLELSPIEAAGGSAKFDLRLALTDEADGALGGTLEYAADLFDPATARRLVERFGVLLAAAVHDPGAPLADLPLMSAAELGQLRAWNDTDVEYEGGDLCVHELVAAQIERTPDAVAVAFEDTTMTYRELGRRAARLAARLRALGVRPDTRVGICVERCLELPAALNGILRVGACYVPLDPGYPADRLAGMLEDADVPVLVTQGHLLDRLPAHGARVVLLEDLPDEEAPLERGFSPDLACYAIFTSGSTGRPKGAINTHRATVNRLLGMQEGFVLTADDRLIQKTPFSFDVSVWELFWAHMVGARLVVARPEGHRDTAYLADTIAREGITFIHFVPSVLQIFLEEPGLERCASLRRLLVGGEALLPDLARRFYERLGGPCGVELHELYGPAEAAIDVTWHPCRPGEERIPIGPPVTNTRLWVLDPRGRLAPIGVPGELHIEGVQVGRGYLGRPELTAERFVPNPFGAPGSRLYRTGDLARFLPDGEVEYLGRIDHQVKIRGVRVELGEIETSLSGHPEVREAVVLARGQGADRALVAYVVPSILNPDRGTLVESMRAHLRARLPESMMPGAFVVLDAMPLSPNLKVDRRALAKIEPEREALSAVAAAAPRTPTQELLAGLWTGLLGLERVGIDESFFHAGGHSLMVTRLASRVRETFGVDLPLRTFFEAPTIEEQAARIEIAAGGVPAPSILRRTEEGPAPLSFAQERLWFLDRLQPGSPVYNMPVQLRLAGRLSVPALERSLAEIVRRHEVLRTVYEVVGDEPRQRVTERTVGLPFVDLSSLSSDLREPEAARLAAAEALRPFDLRQGPLVRVVVLRSGAESWTALFAMHHIAGDGWSYGVLVEELGALYAAFLEGRPSPLPEPAIQYADFASWQRGWLRGEVLESQVRYWREALAGAPRLLDLPTDRPRPAAQTFRGGMIRMELAPALVRSLEALAGAEGVTLFMVLAAAFQALLRRYSGADDLLIATAIANRTRPETERLIGFFVNTLVLRGRLNGDPGFRGLLGRTREAALGAYAHQDLPFERLVDELAVERSLSHNPLVQVMIALQNAPLEPLELPGLTLAPLEVEAAVARLDLSLALFEAGGGLSGTLEYSADLFDRTTVLRLIGHFRTLLERAAVEPVRRLSELPVTSAEERHQLLVEWAGSRRPQPGVSVLRRFDEQAARTPEAVAVASEGSSLTFGQLDRRAGAVAARLRRMGVGLEDRVALFVERSPDLVAALLGIWKAGGAYVPLDPSLPAERLAFLLEDSRPRVLITEEAVLDRLPAHGAPVLLLSEVEGEDRTPGTPGEAAYLIYTSGTTGRPKAVLVGHGNLAHTLEATREAFGFEAGDRMPCLAPFSFDIFLFELLAPLLAGGTSVLVGLRPTLDVRALAASLDSMTLLHAVPALMRQVAEEVRRSRGICAALRRVFVGGDTVPPDLLADLREVFPAARIAVLYGPTEATILASSHEAAGGEDRSLLGRPLPGVELTVVDRDGDPAPAGVPGELCIAGPGVTRGYLGRPELTADRFLPDPRSGEGERVYRSGDLARFRPAGEIEFLGRVDQQVKVRGFRIELGEIEAVLADHPDVSEAVVLVQGEGGDRRLVAYVTGAPSGLREYLRDRLPEYIVPSAFVVLPELPLSPNGKVDRKALSRLTVESEKASEAPRTPAEELLAAIWSDLLGLDRVGVDDNFFERGGHSLMATRLVSRVRDSFGVELPLRAVFEAPTLAAMAGRIGEARGGSALPRIERAAPERPPLSFSQERLWFLDRLQPGGSAYNIPVVLRLSGPLDVTALERSFREVAQRHETLRTTFAEVGGVPFQVVNPEPRVPLPVVDLRSLPEPQAEAERLVAEEARSPFDLERGPLMRLRLIRTNEAEWLLVVNLHHIAGDGWSMGVLVREVGALYGQTALPELPVQYADFAVWQRGWLQGEPLASLVRFWREALAGAPGLLELPMDRPRPAVQSYRGASESVLLPAGLTGSLRALAGREGATPFMVLLAAFQELLRRHSNQDDLLVGTPIANRGRAEVEGLIGFFVNTLALRRPAGARTFRELLAGVRAFTLDAYAHQDLPFEKLVEELGVERSLAHGPLIQVLLALQNNPVPALSLRGLELAPVALPAESAKFDLSLGLGEVEGGAIGGRLDYAADLFDAATARRLLERFEILLGAALADPGLPLADLPLLTAAERAEIAAWNRTAEDFPDVCLHELIEAQVEMTPDAVAVVFEGESLTYRELDEWASALAAELPAELIGIHVERSLEMVVGLVAILKAGGAYVPIDPGYPAERVAFMVEDSGVSVLLRREDIAERRGRDESRSYDRSDPDSLAYMIYTSGSTGRPKGALNSHRGIVNRILWMQREYGLTPADRVLQKTPFSFDVSVWEFFWPLIVGARLVVARPGGHQDPAYLVETIFREEITTLHFVPSMLQVFVEQPGVERCASLRRVMASGEALPADLVNRFFARLPQGVELHNLYGPTEAAVDVTYHACYPGETRVPIGRPVANTRIHILDRDGREAPIGVAGELLIAGVQVGLGYLHRPDLTAERFVPEEGGARMYRTGDLARWLPDGEVEYLGRIDHQVKIRGFRIELGEIEAALARHPGVREAVVLARDQALAAYVVASPPVPLSHLPPTPRRERGDVTGTALPGSQEEASTAFPLSRGRADGRWERGTGGEVL
ncbi:MAG TPA: amino acid adenylation domain-containing protein, partial [Thermoanaerobaculia bacterium]|nr:amino acid adenylation domain-containing protein [Thermoanaerobaculia bacterium]